MVGTIMAEGITAGRLKFVSRCKPWALARPWSDGSGRRNEPAGVLPAANRASGDARIAGQTGLLSKRYVPVGGR